MRRARSAMRLIDDIFADGLQEVGLAVSIDVETTGTNSETDEMLQVALVYSDGRPSFCEFVKPQRHKAWPEAEKITGIGPEDVASAKPADELRNDLENAFACVDLLVGYNLRFDLAFLLSAGITLPDCPAFDVMRAFARIRGRPESNRRASWVSLARCCRYYGVPLHPHTALSDAEATLRCFRKMMSLGDGSTVP